MIEEAVFGFFDYLDRKNLSEDRFRSTISKWRKKEISNFAAEAKSLLPFANGRQQSNFGFIANSSLSGRCDPCSHIDCRLEHADRLARFAILYGDYTLLQDPFEHLDFVESMDLKNARSFIADDLFVIYRMRPLIEAGLVSLAQRQTAFCEEHAPAIVKEGVLHRAKTSLRKTLSKQLDLSIAPGESAITLTGAEHLLEHPVSLWTDEPIQVSRRPSTDGRFRVIGSVKREVINDLIGPILLDLIQQDVYRKYGLNYITDRQVDLSVLEATNDDEAKLFSRAIMEGFSHSLPFIKDVSLPSLIKLRQNEGESFQVYRDAVSAVLRQLTPKDSTKIKQAFDDAVSPHLHKIDLAVSNAKKILRGSIASNIAYGVGLVTVGLASGFLYPDAGKIIATIGGFQFGINALRSVHGLIREPDSIKENPYYFLWKVQRHAPKQ